MCKAVVELSSLTLSGDSRAMLLVWLGMNQIITKATYSMAAEHLCLKNEH